MLKAFDRTHFRGIIVGDGIITPSHLVISSSPYLNRAFFMVNVCEQCGEAYDSTGYSVCQNCQFDTFIKLRKPHEETNKPKQERWQR